MNQSIASLFLPTLPTGKTLRAYDRELNQKLRTWADSVNSQVNTQVQGVGANLPSATTITLTNYIHHVTGAQAIQNIIAPSGFTGTVALIADGAWSLITGGNIATSLTATPGTVEQVTFDGTLWYPVA